MVIMLEGSTAMAERKPNARSRMTNRSGLLPKYLGGVDGRSTWARRLHDLMALHLSDLGGEDKISEPQKIIVRRAANVA